METSLAFGMFYDEASGLITTFSRAVPAKIDANEAHTVLRKEFAKENNLNEEDVIFSDIFLIQNGKDCPNIDTIFHYKGL